MAGGAFGQKEAPASGNFEALVGELVSIGVGKEAEIDTRAPDSFAVLIVVNTIFAGEEARKSIGREGGMPGA